MKVFRVKVNNKSYDVEIEETKSGTPSISRAGAKPAPITANIKKIGTSKKAASGAYTMKAPLSGVIVEIALETGKAVKQGEKILVLEAMKMENAILSPVSGIVEKVAIKVGDSVNGNQEMLVIKA